MPKRYSTGRFCSTPCARSYSTSKKREEINAKVSAILRAIDSTEAFVKIRDIQDKGWANWTTADLQKLKHLKRQQPGTFKHMFHNWNLPANLLP